MTYADALFATGRSGDVLMEHMIGTVGPAGSDITISSGYDVFPANANGKKAVILMPGAGGNNTFAAASAITVLTVGDITLSGTPSSTLKLVTDGVQDSSLYMFAVNTAGKYIVLDTNGTTYLTSPAAAAANDEVVVIYDLLTLSTVWLSLIVNGVEVAACNTGVTPTAFLAGGTAGLAPARVYFGHWTAAGSNPGVTITARTVGFRYTTTAGDAPHLTAYPRIKTASGFTPTADGDSLQWTNGTTTAYTAITTNDGDTSYIADVQTTDPKTAHDALYKHATANPMSGGDTVLYAQQKAIGRINGTSKDFAAALLKFGGSTDSNALLVTVDVLSTAYKGIGGTFDTHPDHSTPWSVSDFDLSGGVTKIQFGYRSVVAVGVTTGALVTMGIGIEPVYYTTTLSKTSTPTAISPQQQVITMVRAKKPRLITAHVLPVRIGAATPVTPNRRRQVWVS